MVGLLDFFTGGDPTEMAQIDPRYGVPKGDVRDAAINTLANISATLLAAGQPIMPAQRAQYFAQLGQAASGANTDLYNAAQRRLMMSQLDQRRSEAEELKRLDDLRKNPEAFRAQTGFDLSQFAGMTTRGMSDALRQIQVSRLSRDPAQADLVRAQIAQAVASGRLTTAQAQAAENAILREQAADEAFNQAFPGLLGTVPRPTAPAPVAPSAAPPISPPAAQAPSPAPTAPAMPAAPAAATAPAAPEGTVAPPARRPAGWALTPEQEALYRPMARSTADWMRINQQVIDRREKQEGESFTRENALRDDFDKRAVPFFDRQTAYRTMMDLARQGEGASDVALVLSLMKVYDPTSTVTGGEAATAQNAAGVPESIRAMFNTVTGGGRLSDTARQQLVNAARQRFFQEMDNFGTTVERYRGLADRYKLNVDNIVQDARDPELLAERTAMRTRTDISRRLTPEIINTADAAALDRVDPAALSPAALQAYQRRRAELSRLMPQPGSGVPVQPYTGP